MKWLILGLMALGCVLVVLGLWITRVGASADERIGGTLPILLGGSLIVLDLVVAFVWLIART